jgi:xanthine dehydrogenase accessory factor
MKHWHETRAVLDFLALLPGEGRRAALATVVRVRGSAYRHEGAKLAVAEDGATAGNVSGGCLEQDVREVAVRVIRTGRAELRSYCSSADEIAAWDLGVGCEGQVDVFVEPATARPRERQRLDGREPFAACCVLPGEESGKGEGRRLIVTSSGTEGDLGSKDLNDRAMSKARGLLGTDESGIHELAGRAVFIDVFEPPPQLVILGAGDDAQPLARFAADVGFRVVVVDRRPGYLTRERFPAAAALLASAGDGLAAVLPLDAACYAVVMTHHFADDLAYARALLPTPTSYIGMLGPRQRTERILRTLAAETQLDEGRVYGPVGLDIGTDGAEQVALAVLAEILAVRSGRRARSLRERGLPIHAPAEAAADARLRAGAEPRVHSRSSGSSV